MENIKNLKAAVEAKYQKKIDLAENERKKDLAAIERVAALQSLTHDMPTRRLRERTLPSSIDIGEKKEVLNAGEIRQVIKNYKSKKFNLRLIRRVIEKDGRVFSRHAYHAAVKTMLRNKEIELEEAGTGKRASTYEKIDETNNGSKKESRDTNIESLL